MSFKKLYFRNFEPHVIILFQSYYRIYEVKPFYHLHNAIENQWRVYMVKRSNFEIDRFTMWNIREMLWRLHVKTVYLETTASFMVKRSNLKIDRFAV